MKNSTSKGIYLSDLRPKGQKISPQNTKGAAYTAAMMYDLWMIQELTAEVAHLVFMEIAKFSCNCSNMTLFNSGCQCGGV